MPRYDVFLEGRTENSTCYFGVAVMADDQKEAEFLGHEAGRVKHQECDEIEVVGVMPVISARNAGKRRLCWSIPLAEVIESVSRFAFKAFTKPLCKEHLDGINKLLDTHFTPEEIEYIYTNLGNGINHELCMKFVKSGYDLKVIEESV